MGTNTLVTKSNGDTIINTDPNQYKDALVGDIVPRATSGAPTAEAGDVGTSTYPFDDMRANRFLRVGTVKSSGTVDLDAGESFFNDASHAVPVGLTLIETITFTLAAPAQVLFYVSATDAPPSGSARVIGSLVTTGSVIIKEGMLVAEAEAIGGASMGAFNFAAGTHSVYVYVSSGAAVTITGIQYGLRLL